MLGLYVHIPFCKQKCRYCDFLSFGGKSERDMTEYVSLLLTELDLLPKQGERLNSVFFGGGTPSLLPTNALPDLLKKLNANYDISGAEITAEANPGTVDGDKLFAWRKAGVNRLSLGVQSFEDGELESIGRIHNAKQAEEAFRLALKAGFSNINLDMMYGLPGQTKQSCMRSLKKAVSLCPEHLSFYSLILEEGTPLYSDVETGKTVLMSEDEAADIGDMGAALLEKNGFERYEVSNYAKKGMRCAHNLNYWQSGDFIAAGLGASFALWSKGEVVLGRNTPDMDEYRRKVASGERPVAETLSESGRKAMFTYIMMGLRLVSGFSDETFIERFGVSFSDAFPKAAVNPLFDLSKGRVRLTKRGFELMNTALCDLMTDI